MAKIDKPKERKQRGGRKPGAWTLLTPEALRAWREANKVSRARLAIMLGVSSTSVQNWETGTVASMKIQQRLAELLAAGPAAVLPPRRAPSLWERGATSGEGDSAITASPDELVGLIRSVRQALS